MTLYTFVLICFGTCGDMSDTPVIVPNLSIEACTSLKKQVEQNNRYRKLVVTCASQNAKTYDVERR